MSINGVLHNNSFERGQVLGVPIAILALVAAASAYKVQSKRNSDAL